MIVMYATVTMQNRSIILKVQDVIQFQSVV